MHIKKCLFFSFLVLIFVKPVWAHDCRYTIAVVPQFEMAQIKENWLPLLNALEEKTDCHLALVETTTTLKFEKILYAGEYDFAYGNPLHAALAKERAGYVPILRSGGEKLKGIIVVKANSDIQDVAQLDGEVLAFPSPHALGAKLLPRANLLQDHNVTIEPKYVRTHSAVYRHVARSMTVAGGGVMRTFKQQPEYLQNALRVLYTTPEVHPHPIIVHDRVSADKRDAIQKALLEISSENPELFAQIPMENPVAASYEDYSNLDVEALEAF